MVTIPALPDGEYEKITLLGPAPWGGTYTSLRSDPKVDELMAEGHTVLRRWVVTWRGGKPVREVRELPLDFSEPPTAPGQPYRMEPVPEGELGDFDPEPRGLTVSAYNWRTAYQAVRAGELVAFAKWHGEHLRVFLPGGTFIGRLYRSEGRRVAGEITYTYRAWTGSDPLQHHAGEREVARGATMADAIKALLDAKAGDAQALREQLDQEQHEASQRYLRGELTQPEYQAVIATINAKRRS